VRGGTKSSSTVRMILWCGQK